MAFIRGLRWLSPLVALALVGACDEGGKAKQTDEGGQASVQAKDEAKDEDKGHANLKLGTRDWSSTRASARVQDSGHLRISASRSEQVDGKTRREALTLLVRDYAGPGSYITDKVNSNFTGVGIDVEAAEKAAAEQDDDKTTELAKDMVAGSTVVLLQDAKVEITKADEDFIDGTFEWSGVGGVRGPRSMSGSFHARIKR